MVTHLATGELTPSALPRLAFWAKNMAVIRDAGMSWPGFDYSDDEWARFDALAAAVGDGAFEKFKLITAVAFIALAAVGIVGGFMPLATVLFPIPAQTPAVDFVLLLAAAALLILGFGLPLAMRIAAALSTSAQLRAQLAQSPGDLALARKVAYQINRIVVIICGVFVPGTLLWIAFNIKAGPIITALKWLSFAALAVSLALSGRARARSR